MSILVNEKTKEFHLFNDEVSYIFRVIEDINHLEHIYYGRRLKHRDSFEHLVEREERPSCNMFERNYRSSLEHIKQEYPCYGTTDFRYPAHKITNHIGSHITNFEYNGYEVIEGKPLLENLPSTYIENKDEASTLQINLVDKVLNAKLILSYTIYNNRNVITRNAKFINESETPFFIDEAMSSSIDFPDSDYELVTLNGAWAREGHVQMNQLTKGVQSVYSSRGASGHIYNPFLALKRMDATEHHGDVYGFSLIYSGNFIGQVEVDTFDVTRVLMGINPFQFSWKLKGGDSFQTPECVMVYSSDGLNGMSQTYHNLYKERLVRGYWRDKIRPILINNWEATYFNFDEEKAFDIAKTAHELGIELFVLDDGWFGKRDDDSSSLGDWFEDREKLPNGIDALSKKVDDLGMKFGLWFEPEMICKDTKLYKEHPDWAIATPERNQSHGRNQFVLDFTRDEVVEHIFEQMDLIIKKSKISYIKWDMNRYITEAYSTSLGYDEQGEFFHRYILGVYKLYDMLIEKYPEILFESCAGGGGRFDPGMLYYAPQTWTSDDTDAIERLKIQYGHSMVYPLKSIGSHVSTIPNHQVGRNTPIETRANVAYFGTFGYELDITQLSDEDKDKVKDQVKFFKQHRELIHNGDFYRLQSPFKSNITSWMVVSENKEEAIVGFYKVLAKPNDKYRRLQLTGLDPNKLYQIEGYDTSHYGDELMNVGILLNENFANVKRGVHTRKHPHDYYSEVFVIKSI